jgi:catechol 2,3-dioxygenase-like lactoylglutathione lyase family enzyme
MDRPPVAHLFAGLPVANYDSALGWYQRLLGRPPDVIVDENEAMWQVVDAGWIYVVGDSSRAGTGLLALLVDDLERYCSEMTERGITIGQIEVEGGVRRVVIADPSGNQIKVGENPKPDRSE